jgi:hypothetical protein
MSDDTLIYRAGSVILFTKGSYSDFETSGLVVAIKECNLPLLAQEFARAYEPDPERHWQHAIPTEFPAWLIVNGYAMPVDVSEVHLGDYDEWAPEFGVPPT